MICSLPSIHQRLWSPRTMSILLLERRGSNEGESASCCVSVRGGSVWSLYFPLFIHMLQKNPEMEIRMKSVWLNVSICNASNLHIEKQSQHLFQNRMLKTDYLGTDGSNSRLEAVSSRDDPLWADQGASAEVISRVQRHLVGLGVWNTLLPPHNLVILGAN